MRHQVAPAVALVFVLTVSGCTDHPRSAGDIRAIARKPHSPQLTLEELKIFPVARKYDVTMTVQSENGSSHESSVSAEEKWVDGIFIVSTLNWPGGAEPTHSIVTFDQKAGVYRKWILLPRDLVVTGTGRRIGNTRSIAWTMSCIADGKPMDSVGQDDHFDDKTVWTEKFLRDGKPYSTTTGEAKVVE